MSNVEASFLAIQATLAGHAKLGAEHAGASLGHELVLCALLDTHPDKAALAASLTQRLVELGRASKDDQQPGAVLFQAEATVERFLRLLR